MGRVKEKFIGLSDKKRGRDDRVSPKTEWSGGGGL